MALSDKQKRFVEEYLIDLNATQAAIRAGYTQSKYTHNNASKLLENRNIRRAIDQAMAERSKRTGVSADRVVRELAKVAFLNPTDVIDMETASVNEWATDEDKATIASVKVKTIPTDAGEILEREVKTYDKIRALELLGKHNGMFTDKVRLENDDLEVKVVMDYGDNEES